MSQVRDHFGGDEVTYGNHSCNSIKNRSLDGISEGRPKPVWVWSSGVLTVSVTFGRRILSIRAWSKSVTKIKDRGTPRSFSGFAKLNYCSGLSVLVAAADGLKRITPDWSVKK